MTSVQSIPRKNEKIKWDISSTDTSHAVMFNDNGIWFEYDRAASIERLKTVLRELASHIPIRTVKIRALLEIGAENCDYRCIYSNRELLVVKQTKASDEEDKHYRHITDNELSSLLGNPSRLLADYWDELYASEDTFSLHLKWDDGDKDREANSQTLDKIILRLIEGEHSGTLEQIDESTGVLHQGKWSLLPEIGNFVKRALWLGKGNIPAKTCK